MNVEFWVENRALLRVLSSEVTDELMAMITGYLEESELGDWL